MRILLIPLLFAAASVGAEETVNPQPLPVPPATTPPVKVPDARDQHLWYGRRYPDPFPTAKSIPRYPIYRTPTDEAWKQEELDQQRWRNQQERLREGTRQSDEFHRDLEREAQRIRNEAR
jgi:hypothetical protein